MLSSEPVNSLDLAQLCYLPLGNDRRQWLSRRLKITTSLVVIAGVKRQRDGLVVLGCFFGVVDTFDRRFEWWETPLISSHFSTNPSVLKQAP